MATSSWVGAPHCTCTRDECYWIISSQQLNVGSYSCFQRIAKKHSCESDVRACIPELQKRCGHHFQTKIMVPSRLLKWLCMMSLPKLLMYFPACEIHGHSWSCACNLVPCVSLYWDLVIRSEPNHVRKAIASETGC